MKSHDVASIIGLALAVGFPRERATVSREMARARGGYLPGVGAAKYCSPVATSFNTLATLVSRVDCRQYE
jgi:hypothetical protein